MYGHEIVDILQSDSVTTDIFKGVYSSDNLPILNKRQKYPAAFIVNTHENNKPGEHWVAFFFKSYKGIPEYFDSYGFPPYKKGFIRFLLNQQRRDLKYYYNNKIVQSLFSDLCGQHTIYYVFQRSNGRTFQSILQDFTDDTFLNDLFVKRFVERMYMKKSKLRKRKVMRRKVKSQCSKCMMKVRICD